MRRRLIPLTVTAAVLLLAALSVSPASASAARSPAPAPAARAAESVVARDCGNGITQVQVKAPGRFDPRTASADQLAAVDFPPRPAAGTQERAVWDSYAARYAAGLVDERLTCALRPHPDAHAALSPYWAGNVDNDHDYLDAEATWVIPLASGGARAYSIHWVGVGLGNSRAHPLVQAGSWSQGNGATYVWLETFPQTVIIQLLDFGNGVDGNTLFVHARFTHAGDASWHIVDESAGIDRSYSQHWDNTSPDGHAEFIAERPAIDGAYPDLANFGTMTFRDAYSASLATGFVPVGKLPHYYYDMINDAGTRRLATTGPISADGKSFSVVFRWPN